MLRIALLAPQHVPALAAGYLAEWPDWYGPRGRGDAVVDLLQRSLGEDLPLGFVALDDEEAVGTVGLSAQSVDSHAHLTPWLIGLWTAPSHRKRGIATQLISAARDLAFQRGSDRLFAATHDAASLFREPDWALHEVVEYAGRRLFIFVAAPAFASGLAQ